MGFGGPEGCVKGGPRVEFDLSELGFPCGHRACESGDRVDAEGKWCTACLLRESVAAAQMSQDKQREEADDESFALPPGEGGSYEHVHHPKHYNEHPSGIECIDVIEHMPFNIGTAMKYLWRAGLKPGHEADQDLKKAIWYIERQRTIGERTKR